MDYEIEKPKIVSPSPIDEPSVTSKPAPKEPPKQPVKMDGYYQPSTESSVPQTPKQKAAAEQARERSAAANANAVAETARIKAEALSTDKSTKVSGYAKVLAKNNKTIYQKTSEILDDYMSNHPEEYPEYNAKSESEKKSYRDAEMGKLFRKLAGKKDMTKAERKTATRDLSILLITIEANDLSLKELSSNPKEMKNLIDQGDKELYNSMLSKIDSSNPDKALDDIAELYLTFTDPDYLLLEGDKKLKYMKSQQRKIFSMFGIVDPKKDINPEAKSNAVNIMKGLLSGLTEKEMTVKDLVNLPASEQSKLLVESLEKYEKEHPEITAKLSPESKNAFEVLKIRSALIQETGKKNPTERDLYNILLKKAKSGNISDQERQILDSYIMIDLAGKKKGKDFLATTADMTSNVAKRLVTGHPYKTQFKNLFDGVDDPKDISKIVNEIAKGINNDTDKVLQLEALRQVMMDMGYKPEEIMAMLPDELAQSIAAGALSLPDEAQVAQATDILASFNSAAVDEAANAVVTVMPEVRSIEWLQYYGANVETTKYDESFATGINQSLGVNAANQVFAYIANNATTDAKKASIVEYSLTTTSDSERVSAYTESYKTIKSSAVTEGMAAAAYNTSNPTNRAIINSGVDYAVANNGYSSTEIKNINTARQTGATSYTSATNSSSSSVNKSSSIDESNPQTSTQNSVSANSTNTVSATSSSSQSVSSNKVNLSSQNSSVVLEINEKLAQIQYEYSVAKKEKAMSELQSIIEKIQNDSELRAQKQAELNRLQSISEDDVSGAITKAEQKSDQKQKDDEIELGVDAVEDIAEGVSSNDSYGLPADTINRLRNAANEGDLVAIYNELGNISVEAQNKFIRYIARKDTATIIGFIKNRSTDKALIRQLCKLNPSLIKSLDPDLLISCGIAKSEIIKYAGSEQLAILLSELARVGDTDQLRQFYVALGSDAQQYSALNNSIRPGDDRYYAMLRDNMSNASITPNIVGNSRFSGGQTRRKIRPNDIDYNDYV